MTRRTASSIGLQHELLVGCGVSHGFGTRDSGAPSDTGRPQQVHGRAVARPTRRGGSEPAQADAIVSSEVGLAIAVVTADCVPILACASDGSAVAAIHAGWRGLSAGVVEAAITALRERSPRGDGLRAVVGPCIGPCCYEVDAPVLEPLERRFAACLNKALRPSRRDHSYLDLAMLVSEELRQCGIAAEDCATLSDVCTCCDAENFHSYRRDGARAGRLIHYIAAR